MPMTSSTPQTPLFSQHFEDAHCAAPDALSSSGAGLWVRVKTAPTTSASGNSECILGLEARRTMPLTRAISVICAAGVTVGDEQDSVWEDSRS
jgi:hypothetical protein